MSLWSDFLTQYKDTKWKHYFPIYERWFRDFVNKPVIVIEIGVAKGGSLSMWKRYFGPHAQIVGIDCLEECRKYKSKQIRIRIGRQEDTAFLGTVLSDFGTPDIVIDDGSHVMSDIWTSFEFLYPKLSKSGIYMVEDLQTCYNPEYGGGYRESGTFIEKCKDLIDELNGQGSDKPHIKHFSKITAGMHIYRNAVVFERGLPDLKWRL